MDFQKRPEIREQIEEHLKAIRTGDPALVLAESEILKRASISNEVELPEQSQIEICAEQECEASKRFADSGVIQGDQTPEDFRDSWPALFRLWGWLWLWIGQVSSFFFYDNAGN